jgi:hypothetical protein
MAALIDRSVILLDGDQADRGSQRPIAGTATIEILPPYAGG